MKSISKLLFVICFVLHTIFSVNAINSNIEFKETPLKKDNSFWIDDQLNWNNKIQFNTNPYFNKNESSSFFNDMTITVSNKKITTSKDDSNHNKKGNNKPIELENGYIKWKGYRFKNLNTPTNSTITSTELKLNTYSVGETNVKVKAEKLNSPTSYSDQDDNLSSLRTTSKSVDWYIPKLSIGLKLVSPNLKDVVQEVVESKESITQTSLIISSSIKWIGLNFNDGSSSN